MVVRGSEPRRALPARRRSSAALLIGVTLTTLVAGFGLPRRAVAHRTVGRVTGHTTRATRTLAVTDDAQLRFVRSSGSLLIEEGSARGTLPGSMRVHCDIGPTVSASFTIYTSKGSIRGHGTATPHGTGVYESFAGSIVVTGGTGSYVHVRGHAGLYGVFDRRNYALTIQTTGRLAY